MHPLQAHYGKPTCRGQRGSGKMSLHRSVPPLMQRPPNVATCNDRLPAGLSCSLWRQGDSPILILPRSILTAYNGLGKMPAE